MMRAALMLLLVVCGLGVVGCRDAAAPSREGLSLLWYGNAAETRILEAALRRFTREHGIAVELVRTTRPAYARQTLLLRNTQRLPDLVRVPSEEVARFARLGLLAGVEGDIDVETLHPGRVASCRHGPGGALAGVPLTMNVVMLYANRDALRAINVSPPSTPLDPWSLDQFLEVASLLASQGAVEYGWQIHRTPATAVWLRYCAGRTDLSAGDASVRESFCNGRCGLLIDDTTLLAALRASPPAFEWDLTYVPRGVRGGSAVSGDNLMVLQTSRTKPATALLRFLARPDVLTAFGAVTQQPPPLRPTGAITDPAIEAALQQAVVAPSMLVAGTTDSVFDKINTSPRMTSDDE